MAALAIITAKPLHHKRDHRPMFSSPRVEPSTSSFGVTVGFALARIRAFTLPVGKMLLNLPIICRHAEVNWSISFPKCHRIRLFPGMRPQVMHSWRASSSSGVSFMKDPSCLFKTKPRVEATWSGARFEKNTLPVLCAYLTNPFPNSPASCMEDSGLAMLRRAAASSLTSLWKDT